MFNLSGSAIFWIFWRYREVRPRFYASHLFKIQNREQEKMDQVLLICFTDVVGRIQKQTTPTKPSNRSTINELIRAKAATQVA